MKTENEIQDAILKERKAVELLKRLARDNANDLSHIAHWGDGHGGYIARVFCDAIGINQCPISPVRKKKKINRALAKKVFERDSYRCVTCGDHFDLTCDHIIPESNGGPANLENLQTMCRSCNSRKGAR